MKTSLPAECTSLPTPPDGCPGSARTGDYPLATASCPGEYPFQNCDPSFGQRAVRLQAFELALALTGNMIQFPVHGLVGKFSEGQERVIEGISAPAFTTPMILETG